MQPHEAMLPEVELAVLAAGLLDKDEGEAEGLQPRTTQLTRMGMSSFSARW